MDNDKLVNITFLLYNGMSFVQFGYKLSDARAIANRFNSYKNNPKATTVMTYESPEEPSKAIVIDLKNIIGLFYQ